MKKINKCEYGYFANQTKIEIKKSIILFIIPVCIFLLGVFIAMIRNPELSFWDARRNLLTLAAVLGLLPAARQITNTVMFVKYNKKHLSSEKYEAISGIELKIPVKYDLYMTTYDYTYQILSLTVASDTIVGYTEDAGFNEEKFDTHIKSMMAQNGLNCSTIKIFNDFDKYKQRLKAFADNEVENNEKELKILRLMENLSL